MITAQPRIPIWIFFGLFTISGFAGLIYESIWSHYLKLFLGHAAYAQTLVLALFMGGMAIGSGLIGHFVHRVRRALLAYAVVELAIGIMALTFHGTFVAVTNWAFDSLLPWLGSPAAADGAKWLIATGLILPPSVLLGTTFPLMSNGIMRRFGDNEGRCLPALYFTNSLGAALGVLISGFVLIEALGLPGTILCAGVINVLLALSVWALCRNEDARPAQTGELRDTAPAEGLRHARLFLLAAFVTGAASFALEIAWIRMLSLAVGASTHSFEVMLSAFILGIALGGLVLTVWQRKIRNPGTTLAWVILAKCGLALAAVVSFPALLDMVGWLHRGLGKSAQGYSLFVAGSFGISMLTMVPTAICAGMTLPLITRSLLSYGSGERAVGQVYACNTLGAIAGTVLATHLGMEYLGVQGLTGASALCEAVLALFMLAVVGRTSARALLKPAVPLLAAFVGYAFIFSLDPLKLASGVYRDGLFFTPDTARVLYHQDGKTATISVVESSGTLDIRTNGKTDAAVNILAGHAPAADEHTMAMLAILPFVHHPSAKRVANIGFGSGLTTHTLLANQAVAQVDSVEIERVMVEGAKLFRPKNELAFSDPRGRVFIEDAKTFFSARNARYDIIISEPSNPWVSGVATLFSEEFYRRARGHLAEDGLLVQWLQLYETKPYVVASIMKALSASFADYAVYHTAGGDAIIIARARGLVGAPVSDPFKIPGWKEILNRLGYQVPEDLGMLRVGGRRSLQPLFDGFPIRANSDYFPVVDINAPRERFAGASATDLISVARGAVSIAAFLEYEHLPKLQTMRTPEASGGLSGYAAKKHEAQQALLALLGESPQLELLPAEMREKVLLIRLGRTHCAPGLDRAWIAALEAVVSSLAGTVDAGELAGALDRNVVSACGKALRGVDAKRLQLLVALVRRDISAIRAAGDELMQQLAELSPRSRELLIRSAVASRIAQQDHVGAARLINAFSAQGAWPADAAAALLRAHVAVALRTAESR